MKKPLSPNRATKKRKIILNLATSAEGYIARPDGDIEWLTRRPPPKGFYGMGKFIQSIDTKLIGRKTYEVSFSTKLSQSGKLCVMPCSSANLELSPGNGKKNYN